MGFSLVLHGTIPKDEIMGVVIGHIYYFFTDVYPPLHNGSTPLGPPTWWRRLFEDAPPRQAEEGDRQDDTVGVIDGAELAARPDPIQAEVR